MQVAMLIRDCGDGSSVIDFFRDVNLARQLASSEVNEEFFANEGDPVIMEVPNDWVPPKPFSDNYY